MPVSASTESERWVAPIPSAEDCKRDTSWTRREVWWWSAAYYEAGKITLDQFNLSLDNSLASPKSINCITNWGTAAHYAVTMASPSLAKWAVSRGIDLTIRGNNGNDETAYEYAIRTLKDDKFNFRSPYHTKERYLQIAEIVKLPPAPATKPCAEVDGQTPLPANEYCIVAENLQSSIKRKLNPEPRKKLGIDYIHLTDAYLSGTGLYPGWTATITLTCSSVSTGCGPLYALDPVWADNTREKILKEHGMRINCGGSGNLLDHNIDFLEAGESVSVVHASDTERVNPFYRNCSAMTSGPFTLSIKTVRLAK